MTGTPERVTWTADGVTVAGSTGSLKTTRMGAVRSTPVSKLPGTVERTAGGTVSLGGAGPEESPPPPPPPHPARQAHRKIQGIRNLAGCSRRRCRVILEIPVKRLLRKLRAKPDCTLPEVPGGKQARADA
ncbi:MAG: hypothetical protein Kow00128_17970 [Deltaproteobacteria bacterium]